MIWIICMLAGLVVMILGSMWGLALLLAGVALMIFRYVTMMRGRGYDPDQGTINGLNGQGKQQSEAVKAQLPGSDEQNPAVWEKMEQ